MRKIIPWVVASALTFNLTPTAPTFAASKPKKWADPCAEASRQLQSSKGSVARLIFGRAALGSLVGAGGRLLFDKNASTEDVVKSAVAGGIVGASSGYWESKRRQNADVSALAGSVYQDAAKSNAEAARALRAFSEVRTCRLKAAVQVKQAYERGEIDETTARARLKDMKGRLEKDVKAAEEFAEDYDQALDSFRVVAGNLAGDKPADKAYVAQFGKVGSSPPAVTMISAKSAVNVRGAASAAGPVVGKLAAGEAVEFIAQTDASWTEVRLASGSTGFVATRYVTSPDDGKPTVRKVNLDKVSPEVKTVGQPLFEGVEKRGALDSEIKLAKANVSGSTFEL